MKLNYEGNSLKSGIYKILNTHTGRIYIGQAKRFKERWQQHSRSLLSGKGHNKFIKADFNKCKTELGHDDFMEFHILEVMEGSTKEERGVREEYWIAQWFDNGKQCYNFTTKAISKEGYPSKNPEETARKIAANASMVASQFKSGIDHPYFGRDNLNISRIHSDKARLNMSLAHIGNPGFWAGKPRSEETRQKISNTLKENPTSYWKGKTLSEETRQKISNSLKNRKKKE